MHADCVRSVFGGAGKDVADILAMPPADANAPVIYQHPAGTTSSRFVDNRPMHFVVRSASCQAMFEACNDCTVR